MKTTNFNMPGPLPGAFTRFIGAIIMTTVTIRGCPAPNLAPIQVVIVPIYRKDEEKGAVMEAVARVSAGLDGLRVHVDDREGITPGFKFNHWELKGVPLRVEIGPKDVQNNTLAISRRDLPGREGKRFVPMAGFEAAIQDELKDIQRALLTRAIDFRDRHIYDVNNYDEFKAVVEDKGWAKSGGVTTQMPKSRLKKKLRPPCVASLGMLRVKASASILAEKRTRSFISRGLISC